MCCPLYSFKSEAHAVFIRTRVTFSHSACELLVAATQWYQGTCISGLEVTKNTVVLIYFVCQILRAKKMPKMQTEYSMDVSHYVRQLSPLTGNSLIMHERTLEDLLVFLSFLKTINTALQYE